MLLSPEDILLQQIGQASCEVFVVLVQHTSILFILWHSAFFGVYALDHFLAYRGM